MKKILLSLPLMWLCLSAFSPTNMRPKTETIEVYKRHQKEIEKQKHIKKIILTFSFIESRGKYSAKGASGEYGKYQILPNTWKGLSLLYFNKILVCNPENQELVMNAVITDWVEKGFTITQIAAKWNCGTHIGWENKIGINYRGVPYNVPKYVKKFTTTYHSISFK